MKVQYIVLAALAACALAPGCATSNPVVAADDTTAALTGPPLRVGVTPSLPPLAYTQGGQLEGIEIDFARQLGKDLDRPVEFVQVDWNDQIDALLNRQTDVIMSGMSITKARGLRVAFVAPYLRAGHTLLLRREDWDKYAHRTTPFLVDARIGLIEGTTGDLLVQERLPAGMRVYYPSARDAAEALVRREIDLFVNDVPVVLWLASAYEGQGLVSLDVALSSEWLAWAVRPDDAPLLLELNRRLRAWAEDGTLDAILSRWLPGMYERPNLK